MLLSLNWLKQFVKFTQTAEQVAEVFTLGGFEVEGIKKYGQGLDQLVVGQIKTIVSHAEADRLSVCKVDIGKKQLLTIVCGARNIKPGQRVPVALVGSVLPNGLKIERRRIRGIDSEGMLCAEDELGLGEDHNGILILDKDLRIGQSLGKATGLEDIVLDIAVTPNRADCFSMIGLAREFSALSGYKFLEKKITFTESKKFAAKKFIKVEVKDKDLCPKYTARVVKNVKVRPSPQWLQSRLMVMGLKPINNIVDISNYVMLEYGQPLHTFDLANIKGRKIIVRRAGKGSKFITLDGIARQLAPEMLVIADSKDPIAVAGVMGGQNSEILKGSKDIVIESAIFKPISIRKTRQQLGLITEASIRFEKGIWWHLPEVAADRAAQMMADLAGGEIARDIIIASKQKTVRPKAVKVGLKYINNLLGRSFYPKEIKEYLLRLNFKVTESVKDELKITVPIYRPDIGLAADIAEEVGRLYGWNKIKPTPIYAALQPVHLSEEKYWERKVKDTFAALGLTEVYNYSYYSQALLEQFGYTPREHYRVMNPLNPEQAFMRLSLVPQLLENLLKNYQTRESIKSFEFGHIYRKRDKGLPDERAMVAGIFYHKSGGQHSLQELKSTLLALGASLGIKEEIVFSSITAEHTAGSLGAGNERLGFYGLMKQGWNKLADKAWWFELDLAKLISQLQQKKVYHLIVQHPVIVRDLTFSAPADIEYPEVVKSIKRIDPLIVSIDSTKLFDKGVKEIRNVTWRITFQAPDRTLKAEEVELLEKKIVAELKNKFGTEIIK